MSMEKWSAQNCNPHVPSRCSSFPVVYRGNNLLEVDLDANFSFPTIVKNISEVDVADMKINHENQVVYQASEQILSAPRLE
jgi:hypothetical protein